MHFRSILEVELPRGLQTKTLAWLASMVAGLDLRSCRHEKMAPSREQIAANP